MRLTTEKKYLSIPVWNNHSEDDLTLFTIRQGEELLYEFARPIRRKEGEPDWFLPLEVPMEADLMIDTGGDAELERRIAQASEAEIPPGEEGLHYHAPYGFINDPNGCVYADGVWHLFHQHNPMNSAWGNMSWGHAVSRDLVHFTFVGDAIWPDRRGVMFSGCGIKNDRKCFGLPEDALLFFYTSAGGFGLTSCKESCFTQRLAYSLDGGKTLIKKEDWEIPFIEKETRDPKVFWHEESGHFVMPLYLNDKRFGIYVSEDMETWERTQEMDYPPMWECPDLLRLKGEGTEKWAFLSADGLYFIGSFDGRTFTPEGEMQKLYSNELPYAAQTWSGTGDRVVQIAWLRTKNRGELWTGMMGVPRELTLGKDSQGFYIRQRFVAEAEPYLKGGAAEDRYVREEIDPSGRLLTARQLW